MDIKDRTIVIFGDENESAGTRPTAKPEPFEDLEKMFRDADAEFPSESSANASVSAAGTEVPTALSDQEAAAAKDTAMRYTSVLPADAIPAPDPNVAVARSDSELCSILPETSAAAVDAEAETGAQPDFNSTVNADAAEADSQPAFTGAENKAASEAGTLSDLNSAVNADAGLGEAAAVTGTDAELEVTYVPDIVTGTAAGAVRNAAAGGEAPAPIGEAGITSAESESPVRKAQNAEAEKASSSASPQCSADLRNQKNTRYVTKGFLAAALILTMIVSSLLGAAFASLFSKDSSSAQGSGNSGGAGSEVSLSEATGSELTVSQIVSKNENAVVEIVVEGTSQNFFGQTEITQGAGSGVIMTDDGYIVTNYHVISGATAVVVKLHSGESYDARIVGGDKENDIAVIKINAKDLTSAEIGDSNSMQVGDLVVAIGNPLGQLGGTATTGIISALDRKLNIDNRTLTLMQTDAAINPGNSGGGLFSGSGQLIGIVDAKSSGADVEGLGFAIPINSVKDIIDGLIKNGTVASKPAIGVMIQDVSAENAQAYGLEAAGVYIANVTGRNARKAGFQTGDRIIALNGKTINSADDLVARVRENKVGDTVSVVVSRDGIQIEIRTVLDESTAAE